MRALPVALLLTSLALLSAARPCNQYTRCDKCTEDVLCQWCGKEYFSAPGPHSRCHTIGSLFGCMSWIRECSPYLPLENSTDASLAHTHPPATQAPSHHPLPSPVRTATKSPLPNLDVFSSPWMSHSETPSISPSPPPSESPSISPSVSPSPSPPPSRSSAPSPSITVSESVSESAAPSPSPSPSPSESAAVSPSVSMSSHLSASSSFSPPVSASESTSETPSFSASWSITPSPSLLCMAYYWTDCEREHPGCREGFTAIDTYSILDVVDSNGWTQSFCMWPFYSHWKCCMNMAERVEPPEAEETDKAWSPHVPSFSSLNVLPVLGAVAVLAVGFGYVLRRQQVRSLASQDATSYNMEPEI